MKILIVGGGGREHALAWRLVGDASRHQVYCAPGNAGTVDVATNLTLAAENLDGLVDWARLNRPDLTVVGPEAPLCAGLVDRLSAEGLRAFGPTAAGARIEGSKAFAKEIMACAGVPTAAFAVFDDPGRARDAVARGRVPVVVKADGLAAGKGVSVCATRDEAFRAIEESMERRVFGEAGRQVVIEECIAGEEASILALTDGERVVMLASAQDHKRAFDGDRGPNTGGMGAYSPAPVVTERLWPLIREQVFDRSLAELRKRGILYRGVLYAGLMVTADGLRVLEFNCRFGDPETQAILPRIAGDLAPALAACATGGLQDEMVRWKPNACVCVVMASGGYPGPCVRGQPIEGLADVRELPGVTVFHAGTARQGDRVVTAGGRVLGVTALGATHAEAVRRVYGAVSRIRFEGAHYRKDIAARAIRRGREEA